jgi:hypothetical protein
MGLRLTDDCLRCRNVVKHGLRNNMEERAKGDSSRFRTDGRLSSSNVGIRFEQDLSLLGDAMAKVRPYCSEGSLGEICMVYKIEFCIYNSVFTTTHVDTEVSTHYQLLKYKVPADTNLRSAVNRWTNEPNINGHLPRMASIICQSPDIITPLLAPPNSPPTNMAFLP